MAVKRNYLIRGIGIGVILTTVLFFFFKGDNGTKWNDEDVIKRARELGMVTMEEVNTKNLEELKNEVIKEEIEPKKEEKASTPSTEGGKDSKKAESTGKAKVEAKVPSKAASEVSIKADSKTADKGKNKAEVKEVKKAEKNLEKEESSSKSGIKEYHYTVRAGSSAVTLCNDLQKLGLIKDAKDFNTYLANHNYARKIRAGSFTFYSDEDYLSIATKLISRKLHP